MGEEEEEEVDRRRGGKTIAKSEQGWSFANSQRDVENRKRWRELVAKSSVVPQRSLRVTGKVK